VLGRATSAAEETTPEVGDVTGGDDEKPMLQVEIQDYYRR